MQLLVNDFNPFDGCLDIIKDVRNKFLVGQGLMSYNKNTNTFLYATFFLVILLFIIILIKIYMRKNVYVKFKVI